MAATVDEVMRRFATLGAERYGSEAVNQIEHACQCAALAEAGGAPGALVAAAFLHDFGHLLADQPHEIGNDVDDIHQYLPLPFLRGLFPESVLAPVALHVEAKRYLCGTEPGYQEALSPASRHSLELQGGAHDAAAAAEFIARPWAPEAVRLRRWDDLAKVPGRATPGLAHYAALLRRVAIG